MRFFKNSCKGGGGWEVFTRSEGEARNGGGGVVLQWWDGKLLKSLYIIDRGVLTPLFYEDSPLHCITSLFQVLSNSPTYFPVLCNPYSHCSFCCPVSLAEWAISSHLMCYST